MPLARTVINNHHVQSIVKGSNSSATTTKGTLNEATVQMEQEPSAVYFLAEQQAGAAATLYLYETLKPLFLWLSQVVQRF